MNFNYIQSTKPEVLHGRKRLDPTSLRNKTYLRASRLIQDNKFDKRIRRLIKTLLSSSQNYHINSNGNQTEASATLSKVSNTSNSVVLRITWGLVLLVCFIICIFQIYTRFSRYLSKPIVVDVIIEENLNVQFPSATFESPATEGALRILLADNRTISPLQCITPTKYVFDYITGVEVNKIWNMLNMTESVTMATLITSKGHHNLSATAEIGRNGLSARYEIDYSIPYEGPNSRIVIKIKKPGEQCKTFVAVCLQPPKMPTDIKNTFVFQSLTDGDLIVTVKKFRFVNRRSQICTDEKTYTLCIKQCTIDKFRHLPCRLPFLPEDLKLPLCISGPETKDYYAYNVGIYTTLNCQCYRPCEVTTYHVDVRYNGENENNTEVSIYMATNLVVVTTERFAYDLISFFGDVGGTLGLYLGLSLPGILDVLGLLGHSLLMKGRDKNSRSVLQFHADPIFRLVERVISEELRYLNGNSIIVDLSTILYGLSVRRVIWCCLITCGVAVNGVFMYVRIMLFWSVPTHMTVNIVYKNNVHFPNVTICGLTTNIIMRMKNLEKTQGHYHSGYSTSAENNWCDLQLIDLLDDPTINVEQLWRESSVFKEYENSLDFGKILLNKSFVDNVSLREVTLPDGNCVEFHTGEQPYAGSLTMLSRVVPRTDFSALEEELIRCKRQYGMIFITPPNEIFHLNTGLHFPNWLRTAVIFETKKVTLLNIKRKPCVDKGLANNCYISCFEMQLEKNIPCRLPYFPSVLKKLPTCNSSRTGKQAHSMYKMQAMTFDPLQYEECGCQQSCERTIISSSVFVEPNAFPTSTFVNFFFSSNIYEHIEELRSDSISSLVCDIGGNLGLALGISVLSLFDVVISLLTSLMNLGKKRQSRYIKKA